MTPPSSHAPEGTRLKIFMAAGEVSGDRQAGYLARAIREQNPAVTLFGSGGERMREAGVDVRIQTSHYGSVGIQESVRFVRPLRGVLSELRALILAESPDLAVLVDNEGFNGILAKFLHSKNIPFIYYFPPQVWLWGEWRARAIALRATAIIPAFKAEADIYEREGGRVEWFGHPLLDIVKAEPDHTSIFKSLGLDPAARTIAVMPGSRFQELEQLTAPMLSAIRTIKARYPNMQVILPLAAPHLRPALHQLIAREGMTGEIHIITSNVYTCLNRCEMLMLSSGTATLEAALLGVPMVVAYRVSPVTYLVGRTLINSRFIAMPNILLDERVVPELIQQQVTAEQLSSHALRILENREHARSIRSKLAAIRPMLGNEGVLNKVAAFVLRQTTARHAMEHATLA